MQVNTGWQCMHPFTLTGRHTQKSQEECEQGSVTRMQDLHGRAIQYVFAVLLSEVETWGG